ncbi:FAD-binding oxidoreductase [Roseateles sp. DAIF2]|uniref:FAD-binding oxidoreductase n=1 Tax=Roseateles sp. DAIF2 TaxID=2714952 RepID=UPI0018A32C45|nr:FAD-binding oxidoreductase [Roseateles sp. DAIF2]QPF73581.1 FAD-binding oxidoreductase [Roseateles sp. DAIF2]
MDRRRFLTAAGGLTGGLWLPGCGGGGGGSGETATPPVIPPPAGLDWEPLARQLQGQLLRPGQTGYDTARRPANARYDTLQPQALARCNTPADVVAALAFARQHKLPLTPRGGGHSYVGASTGEGLVIDVGPMNAVRLEGEVAVIGAGATLADVYAALIDAGRCIAAGSCVSVGIAGLTLGGGFGVLDRRYGLTCDQLVGARLVLADGRQLDCSATQNPELLWALRGAGGGQFGIVTELRLSTHALTPLCRFGAAYRVDELPAVLAAWQDWNPPDWIWSQLVLSAIEDFILLWGIASADAATTAPVWQALQARIGRTPMNDGGVTAFGYRQIMLEGCGSLDLPACHLPAQRSTGQLQRVAMAASSDFFDAPLDAAGIQALGAALQARRGQRGSIILNLMGGAIARVEPAASAFAHRGALFSAQYLADYFPGTAAATLDEAATWTHGMRATMARWSSGRAYQNYPDLLIGSNGPAAYYGAQLARLRQLKAQYDPDRVFAPPASLALNAA